MTHRRAHRAGGPLVFGIAALLLNGLAGCGRSTSETFLPVEGQVNYSGKALTTGTVVLYPDTDKGNATKHEPRGTIGTDGRYKIDTHPHKGAPAGWYKVGVVAKGPSDPKNPYAVLPSLIPEKFGKPDESGLTLEVRPDAPAGAYDLNLK